ncbi:MAG TPA: hypothetical protein VK152_11630 [Paludibacter sp.]|nr:hypothetical protein [Paludibacter sp.]
MRFSVPPPEEGSFVMDGRPVEPRYMDMTNKTPDMVIEEVEDMQVLMQIYLSKLLPGQSVFVNNTIVSVSFDCYRSFRVATGANSWRIEMSVRTNDISGRSYVYRFFPFGCSAFNYNPEDVRSYTWLYEY